MNVGSEETRSTSFDEGKPLVLGETNTPAGRGAEEEVGGSKEVTGEEDGSLPRQMPFRLSQENLVHRSWRDRFARTSAAIKVLMICGLMVLICVIVGLLVRTYETSAKKGKISSSSTFFFG